MAKDPLQIFTRWFNEARRAEIPLAEAVALATADRRGRPSVRFVLLKGADQRGFVIFTNATSRKGREMADNPNAALAIHWEPLGRQVRVEGRVTQVDSEEADAYWATRPRESQLAALASHQSHPIDSRATLMARWKALDRKYRGVPVPRPPAWTGFRIVPRAIEFWIHRDHRLHDRELFVRVRNGWRVARLQP